MVVQRARANGLMVIVVSGREDIWSFVTTLWLAENGIHTDALFFRQRRDFRSDAVVKNDLLGTIQRRFNVRLALDDRDDIIDVWQSAGLPTVKVHPDGHLGPVIWPNGEALGGQETKVEMLVAS